MKRLLLGLLGMLVFTSLGASIKWDWDLSTESYDFESGGIYYGIISESRGEVHVMNPRIDIYCDPYGDVEPIGALPPEYRFKAANIDDDNISEYDRYSWPGGAYKGEIEIPATVKHDGKTYTVVRIAYGAFAWCDGLKSINLPSSIREIRYGAFSMCTSLTEINLPAGVRVCGGAFYGCKALKDLDFSECEFQYYEYEADAVVCQCEALEKIYLPKRWHKESFHCYLEEVIREGNSYVEHRCLGDYYMDYDDFPYTLCKEHTEVLWGYDAQEASDVTKHTRNFMSEGNNDDNGAEVWGYPRQLCELEGNKNLREIHATSVVPLELHGLSQGVDGYWDFLYDDCVLYVPEGSLEAYSSTAPWSNFKHILEETQASVDVVPVAGFESAAPRRIYDLSGNLRATLSSGEIPELAPGLYIERCGSVSKKVVVM